MKIQNFRTAMESLPLYSSSDISELSDNLSQYSNIIISKANSFLSSSQKNRLRCNELEYAVIFYTVIIFKKECMCRVVDGHCQPDLSNITKFLSVASHISDMICKILDFGPYPSLIDSDRKTFKVAIAAGLSFSDTIFISEKKCIMLETLIKNFIYSNTNVLN